MGNLQGSAALIVWLDSRTEWRNHMPAEYLVPTPTGHVYEEPTDYDGVMRRSTTCAQGYIESWDDPEMPPDPTWRMLGLVYQEVEFWRSEAIRTQRKLDYLTTAPCSR